MIMGQLKGSPCQLDCCLIGKEAESTHNSDSPPTQPHFASFAPPATASSLLVYNGSGDERRRHDIRRSANLLTSIWGRASDPIVPAEHQRSPQQ